MSFRGNSRGGGRGGGGFGGRGGSFAGRGGKLSDGEKVPGAKLDEMADAGRCRTWWLPTTELWTTSASVWYAQECPREVLWSNLVAEMGSFVHACEGEMICESINPKIPYFNAPIYLENKVRLYKRQLAAF